MANIPYSGFNGTIATYTADTCISNVSVTANTSWITVLNGNSAINGNVQANTTLSSRTATVTVEYKADTTDCSKTFDVTQDARPCNCGDLTINTTALTWANTSTDKKEVTISSTTNATCLSNLNVSVAPTGHFNASINGNKIEITPTSANTSTSPITATATLSYKASSSNCSSAISLTHSAMDCECGMLTLSPTSLNWAYSATSVDSSSVTISKDSCITNVSVPQGTNFTTSLSNDTITIRPKGKNISPSELSETILVSYSAGASTCTSAITLTQESSGACNCGSVIFTEKTTTIGSDATSNTVIATASFDTCSGSLGAASVNSEASSWLTARTSGNDVIVNAAANTELSNDRSGVVTVAYKANSFDDGYSCSSSFTVTQLSFPCTCKAVSLFIKPIRTEFGRIGTNGNRVLIAEGDTHGCGTLTAGTETNMLEGGHLIVEDVDGSGYQKVRMYANVLENTGQASRSCGVTIIYTPKDPSIEQCVSEQFVITQDTRNWTRYFAECNDLSTYRWPGNLTFWCDELNKNSKEYAIESNDYTTISKYIYSGSTLIYTLGWYLEAQSDSEWITVYSSYYLTQVSVNQANISGADRVGTVTFTPKAYMTDRNGTRTLIEECPSSSITVTQHGCTTEQCNECESYSMAESLSTKLQSMPRTIIEVDLKKYISSYSFCDIDESDVMYTFSIKEGYLDWVSIDSDSILHVSANYGSARTFTLVCEFYTPTATCSRVSEINATQEAYEDYCNCSSDNYTVRDLDDASYSGWTITVNSQISADTCGIRWALSTTSGGTPDEEGVPEWIRLVNTASTRAEIKVYENQNSSSRSATVYLGVYKLEYIDPSGREYYGLRCPLELLIEQDGKPDCDCSGTWSSQGDGIVHEDRYYTPGYYTFHNSGDCISYDVSVSDDKYIDVNLKEYDNRLFLSATSKRVDSDCHDVTVTLQIKNGEDICHTEKIYVTASVGRVPISSSYLRVKTDGYTTCFENVSDIPSGTVGVCKITGFPKELGVVGTEYEHYILSANTTSEDYFNDYRFVWIGNGSYELQVKYNTDNIDETKYETPTFDAALYVLDCNNQQKLDYDLGRILTIYFNSPSCS